MLGFLSFLCILFFSSFPTNVSNRLSLISVEEVSSHLCQGSLNNGLAHHVCVQNTGKCLPGEGQGTYGGGTRYTVPPALTLSLREGNTAHHGKVLTSLTLRVAGEGTPLVVPSVVTLNTSSMAPFSNSQTRRRKHF